MYHREMFSVIMYHAIVLYMYHVYILYCQFWQPFSLVIWKVPKTLVDDKCIWRKEIWINIKEIVREYYYAYMCSLDIIILLIFVQTISQTWLFCLNRKETTVLLHSEASQTSRSATEERLSTGVYVVRP